MGYSTNVFTPSTFVAGITNGATLAMQAVTSSGAYFSVGDGGQAFLFVANASSSDTGAIFIEPGSSKWSGSLGLAASTGSTVYSTATAPAVISVAAHGVTGSSAMMSTTLSYAVFGPFDTARFKSTDERIYVVASTGSTKMVAAVYVVPNGSTQ